jgi:hypothetical protein
MTAINPLPVPWQQLAAIAPVTLIRHLQLRDPGDRRRARCPRCNAVHGLAVSGGLYRCIICRAGFDALTLAALTWKLPLSVAARRLYSELISPTPKGITHEDRDP